MEPEQTPEQTPTPQPVPTPASVSGNVPPRQPENYYQDPEPENYGTLAAYDAYSRTYHVDGDRYVTVIGYDGNSYLDEDGNLQQADNTLVESEVSTYSLYGDAKSYVNSAGSYQAMLTVGAEEGTELLTIASDDHLLTLTPARGDFTDGIVKDNAIRYNNVLPDVDYQYTIFGNSVKEDIILLQRDTAHSFRYLLNTYGLKATLSGNTLYLYEEGTDPEQDAVFVLEAPEMEDAVGEISFGVELQLEESGEESTYAVTVSADSDWLDADDRVYPVRIDPTAIQVGKSAIHVACAEQGSPNSVIGDNAYPYVGYDDGITSGNLAGFHSKHLNCRSYFAIDYDFSALAEEPEIVSAAFQVTQKTRWSKGSSEFGLFGVEEPWQVGSLTWNNQLNYNHYFLDSRTASTTRGEALSFDVTEEVSAWINGTAENHGLVMKALVEAPNETAGDAGASMQCEVFYNNSSASYAPKLIVSWTGDLTDLAKLTLDDTTVDVYPVVRRNGDKSCDTLGVAAHGLAKPGSTVTYELVNGTTGETEAQTKLLYPDSDAYAGEYPEAIAYKRRLSNWQSEVFSGLQPGQVYYVTATASFGGKSGKTVESDRFLIYEEGAFDLMPRIAQHYGVELNTILADMRMQDCLTRQGNRIFIREPKNTTAYSSGVLSEYYKAIIDGLLLGRAENCEFGYEPVNLNTGNFYMEQTDATIADIGSDFALTRQYNAKGAAYEGSLGFGWTFAYDERMGELADGSVLWLRNNGGIITFTPAGEGYLAPVGCDYGLSETENGYVVEILDDGSRHEFDSFGLLRAVEDSCGNRTELAYDVDLYLKSITTPSGKEFRIALDEKNRLSSITLPDGHGVTYTYDEAGNLAQVTNPAGGVVRYVYDDSHRMTAWYDENGHRVVANEYDGEGRVIQQTDAEGGVVTLAYEQTAGGGQTTATDAEGNVTVYTYDDNYRTTKIEYPDGTFEERSYNTAGYLAGRLDRTGVETTYTYDGKGRVTQEKRQDGATRTYAYNTAGKMTQSADYDGGKTGYTYDGQNRLTSVTDAEGGQTSYTYDEKNRLVAVKDANGNTTSYTYDGACVTSMTDGAGNTWNYTYDAMNRLLTVTDPAGGTTANTYDALGRVIKETDAAGAVTVYTYDPAGAVTAITDKEGQTSTFTYDAMNRMLSGTDPLGNTLTYTYDGNGNRLTQTDAEQQTIQYTYDAMNRVTETADAKGAVQKNTYDGADRILTVTDRLGNAETYTYDPVKQSMVSAADREGNVTSYESDVTGRITKITYADGATETYRYDHLSRLTKTVDALGAVTTYIYDGNGNVTKIRQTGGEELAREYTYAYDERNLLTESTDPLGNTVHYTYDACGSLTAVTDGRGNTTSYSYDALARLTAVTDACGGTTAYTYDKEGRVLTVTAPEGDTLKNTYDAIGQLTAQTDALGNVTTYSYDRISRLQTVTDALKGETGYTYDADSNLTLTKDPLGNAHAYTVDAEGNLLKETYPDGETDRYTYDKNGNVASFTDRYGVVTTFTMDACGRIVKASDTAGNEMTYTYDAAGNLTTQTDVLGRTASVTYDAFGRAVAVTGIDGVTTRYTYDASDRLLTITDGEGKVTSYAYDAEGNLIHTTEPGKAEYAYTYDALNRLTRKVDPEGAATEFFYDRNSNLTTLKDGNGVTTDYTYDALNRLAAYRDGNGGTTAYTYDALSRLTAITTPEGLTESYAYDAAGNLTGVTDALGQTTTYGYDKLYRMITTTSPMGAVEKYTYDRHDVVTSVTDALGNVTLYTVDANGQVTKKRQPDGESYLYTYDAVQRLTGITTPLGYETAFTYSNGNDILVKQDNLDRITEYTYDIMHRLTSVTDPEGGVTTYGYDERGNQSEVTDALGYSWNYAYDKVDRMTTVTDPEEKVTGILYDQVGNVVSIKRPGERTTAYAYDGNYNTTAVTDPKGYIYNYAYDKDDRLTLTTDPLEQTTGYTYDAVNRITTYRDKMGLTESYLYDAHGNVLEKTATDGRVTEYTYDIRNRLTSVTDPMGSVAYYTYDVMDRVTGVTDYLGRGTEFTYDREGNVTSVTDAAGRKEVCTYDIAGRITSYTSNGGNRISYDYDKLDDLVEKSYSDSTGEQSAEGVTYAYNALGERVAMQDTTGDTEYTYDGLRRITSVTTYRAPGEDGFSHEEAKGDTIGYTYDEADHLAAITYADGTKVSYEYDKNDNLIKVTDREGKVTTYTYDAINRVTRIHRPNGISTYNTYNARNQIVELKNVCDTCEWVVSDYLYTYDDRGFIAGETAIESLAGYAYDDKHNGRHEDGRHDDLYPHGNRHNGKHDKDATFAYQIVETDRTFTYDAAGKLLTATETEDNYGTCVYTFEYDLMGNRTYMEKTLNETVVEWHRYEYNESNQLISEKFYNGKKTTSLAYTYDADGNRISETGRIGTDKVNRTYEYSVENRLAAVHDGDELLLAAAYDGDGNRVFLLNYNLHTDDDWKGNSGNGNGNNKDNSGSGNNGKGNSGNNGNGNGNGKGKGNNKKNSKSGGTDDAGYGNATNAEENNSQNQCGILFPVQEEVSATEADLIARIKTTGKEKNYELIEYLNDVNREHAEVLVEQNINGRTDTSYIYGAEINGGFDRISLDRFDGSTGYYLYDARGSVSGITNEEGQVYQSYRYSVTGEITFGAPQYENEYTYNGESYNPNIESQYLRARYYCVVTATFLTEDSYIGNQTEPLTLNRYNYCVSSYLNYTDPSGKWIYEKEQNEFVVKYIQTSANEKQNRKIDFYIAKTFLSALHELNSPQASVDYVLSFDYKHDMPYAKSIMLKAYKQNSSYACEIFHVSIEQLEEFGWKAITGDKQNYIIKFNRTLNQYGITSKASITMLMATMAHESNFGQDNIEGMQNGKELLTKDNWKSYIKDVAGNSNLEFDDRGVGYIQLTGKQTQENFLKAIGRDCDMVNFGMDKVHYIAKYYSLEAAAWFWATTNVVKTGMGSLNDYVNANGNSEAIFLITQYYVNGFTATDKDLATIRLGGEYKIKNDQLIVGNNSNPLPKNWRDRSEKYDKAYEIFGK